MLLQHRQMAVHVVGGPQLVLADETTLLDTRPEMVLQCEESGKGEMHIGVQRLVGHAREGKLLQEMRTAKRPIPSGPPHLRFFQHRFHQVDHPVQMLFKETVFLVLRTFPRRLSAVCIYIL